MNNIYRNGMAQAKIAGNSEHPALHGTVTFQQLNRGLLVNAEIYGLPDMGDSAFFGFHIHDGDSCTGNKNDAFADAGVHLNTTKREHPYHEGDLPQLLSCKGFAYMSVLTGRVTIKEIIGKSVIIHGGVDDFISQPAGNTGEKIACGIIMML